jgi:hypothetical protein
MSLALIAAIASAGAQPLAFDIDQATRSGSCNSMGGSCTATSNAATTTTAGGNPPYIYLWEFVSGDSFTITTPTADNTTFSLNNAVAGDPVFMGVYRCTVTDDDTTQLNDTVTVTLNFIDTT